MTTRAFRSILQNRPVAFYFVLVYAFAWAVWIPLAVARRGAAGEAVNLSLTLLAGAAPSLAATLAAWLAFGGEGVRRLWRRLGWFRIGAGWYLAALLIPAGLQLLAAALIVLFGGRPSDFPPLQPLSLLTGLLMYIPMAAFEEIGWRGFAQPGLQRRFTALGASAILGLGWSFWHLPYFLIPDFSFLPADAAGFIGGFALYAVGTIPTCILIAWLFNNSGGSLVLPCIFHGATNVFAGAALIPLVKALGLPALAVSVALSALAAGVVVAVFGARRLSRAPAAAETVL